MRSARSPRLRRPESDRKVVPDTYDADRSIPSDVDGRPEPARSAGSPPSLYYYNFQRPNQALDNPTPAEEVMNRLTRHCQEFQLLREELVNERGLMIIESKIRVVRRSVTDGRDYFVTSFPLRNEDSNESITQADIGVKLNNDESVESVRSSIGYGDTNPDRETKTVEKITAENDEIRTEMSTPNDVRVQASLCGPCKSIYPTVCRVGCFFGFSSICLIYSAGLGAAACEAVVSELCNVINKRSCKPTGRVVCQIAGFCPVN